MLFYVYFVVTSADFLVVYFYLIGCKYWVCYSIRVLILRVCGMEFSMFICFMFCFVFICIISCLISSIQHSEHGESLESRIVDCYFLGNLLS